MQSLKHLENFKIQIPGIAIVIERMFESKEWAH